jgi:hypothetical protein
LPKIFAHKGLADASYPHALPHSRDRDAVMQSFF